MGLRIPAAAGFGLPVRCAAWALRLPWYAFFCGTTAAALHGIPLPARIAARAEIHVGVRSGRRRVEAAGATAHHLTLLHGDVVVLDGIRVTSVERTWCDLAGALTLAELVAAGDALIWRKNPRSTLDRLISALERYPGRRGLTKLRVAIDLLTAYADSAPESEIRVAVLEAGLPAPEVNVPIFSPDGVFVAQPDLSWPAFRVAMEYEGDHHRTDRAQWYEDIRRVNDLGRIAWTTIRATAPDYRDPRHLLENLSISLRAGGWSGARIRHW